MVWTSRPRQSDQHDGKAGCEQNEANIVNLLDLLPPRFLEVVLWTRRWVVEHNGSNHAQDSVDDTNIVAPPPAGGGILI